MPAPRTEPSSDLPSPAGLSVPAPATPGKPPNGGGQKLAPAPGTLEQTTGRTLKVGYLTDSLNEAELLLGYVAEMGISMGAEGDENTDEEIKSAVLQARLAHEHGGMNQEVAAKLLSALSTLARTVRPVTVESLQQWEKEKKKVGTEPEWRTKLKASGGLLFKWSFLVLLLAISISSFVSSRISDTVKADIDVANALAAKLAVQLGPATPVPEETTRSSPATEGQVTETAKPEQSEAVWFGSNGPPRGVTSKDVIGDLQKFAATMRAIDGYGRQLNYFIFNVEHVPFEHLRAATNSTQARTNRMLLRRKFELTAGLNVPLAREFTDKLQVYQEVRNFAINVSQTVQVYYGAAAACVLPILYALFGAAAFLLRQDESEISTRTFTRSHRHIPRYLIAGIGGLVIGQFNFSQGVALSPLALAFLVGYAVDVFFSFLEGLLQSFKREAPPRKQG